MPIVTFTASGTWTVPAGIDLNQPVLAECIGSGGSPAGSPLFGYGGGQGGGYAAKDIAGDVDVDDSLDVVVGSSGGDTSVELAAVALVLAKGGADGSGATGGTSDQLTAAVGTTKYSGGNGANAGVVANGGGGGAAASTAGNGAAGNSAVLSQAIGLAPAGNGGVAAPAGYFGGDGGTYGGGGGGHGFEASVPTVGTGAGADGWVRITYSLIQSNFHLHRRRQIRRNRRKAA